MPSEPKQDHYHREVVIDQRPAKWWDKWMSPAGLMVVFGGLVWGIQLNFAVLTQQADIAGLKEAYDKQQQINHEHALQMTRIALLIDQVVEKVERLDRDSGKHEAESGLWKRMIENNKTRIDHLEETKR